MFRRISFLLTLLMLPTGLVAEKLSNKTQFLFGYEHYQFISANKAFFRDGAASGLELLTLGFKQERDWGGSWVSNVDANFILSPIEKKFYINAPEFYLKKTNKKSSLYIGRKLQDWSWADSYWNLGLWRPRFLWERASPDEAGLIGVHFNKRWNKNLQTLFFISPLYIPEFTAGSFREDGVFRSENPWFSLPTELVNIPGLGANPIFYEVNRPGFADIVLRPSVGLSLRWGQDSQWMKLSYIYKPNHRLLTNIEATLGSGIDEIILDGENTDIIESRPAAIGQVEIHPELFYHHLVNLETKLKLTEKLSLLASYNFESVDRDLDFGPRITYKNISDGHLGSIALKYFFTEGDKASHVSLGYMNLSGGDEPDGGDLASGGNSLFTNHYRYKNAFKAEVVIPEFQFRNKHFSTKFTTVYDLDFNGIVFSNTLDMSYNENWKFGLKVDLIGLLDDKDIQKSFMSIYRSNDQISLGVSYVF